VELAAERFPSDTPGGAPDGLLALTPLFGLSSLEDAWAFELGVPLRLRVVDHAPSQRGSDVGGWLVRDDWDELSDLGQVLRLVRIGDEGGALVLRAGPLEATSLGRGHLVSRYEGRLNERYHPSGAQLRAAAGPLALEAMVSDVFAGRIVAGELALDVGRLAARSGLEDRMHLAVSAAHDVVRTTPAVTLAFVDGDLALAKGEDAQLFLHAGAGARLGASGAGALAGLTAQWDVGAVRLGAKLQARRQGGGFAVGFFGPAYELARFSAVGMSGPPLAQWVRPPHTSGYGELALEVAAFGADRVQLTAAAEAFGARGLEADAALGVLLLEERLAVSARALVRGVGLAPWTHLRAEARWRWTAGLYGLGSVGTLFFPQANGSLVSGVSAVAGMGVDFALPF
jgi:hypothetical protein